MTVGAASNLQEKEGAQTLTKKVNWFFDTLGNDLPAVVHEKEECQISTAVRTKRVERFNNMIERFKKINSRKKRSDPKNEVRSWVYGQDEEKTKEQWYENSCHKFFVSDWKAA